jgi:hypothetical protein
VVPSGQGVGNGALYDGTGLVDARAVGRSRGRGRKVQEGVEGGVLMVGFIYFVDGELLCMVGVFYVCGVVLLLCHFMQCLYGLCRTTV